MKMCQERGSSPLSKVFLFHTIRHAHVEFQPFPWARDGRCREVPFEGLRPPRCAKSQDVHMPRMIASDF